MLFVHLFHQGIIHYSTLDGLHALDFQQVSSGNLNTSSFYHFHLINKTIE